MRKFLVVIVAVLSLCFVAAAQEATTAASEKSHYICVRVEIPNVSDLSANLQSFVSSVYPDAPMPPMEMMLIPTLKAGDPTVLNLEAPLQIVLFEPPLISQPVIVFSVTDADAYFGSLPEQIEQTGSEGDVRLYKESSPFGGPPKPLAIGAVGNRIAISPNPDAVKAALALMTKGDIPATPTISDGADAAVQVELKKTLEGLDNTMGNPFQMIKGMMSMAMAVDPNAQKMMPMLQAEIDAFEDAVREMDDILLRLSFTPNDLRVHLAVHPVAGGSVSTYLASVPAGDLRTLKYLPADAMLVGGAKVGDMAPLVGWYRELLTKMSPVEPPDQFLDLMAKMVQAQGDEISFAVVGIGDGGMQIIQAINYKDPETVAALLEDMPAFFEDFNQMYKSMGMDMSFEVEPMSETYKGKKITGWTISFDFGAMAGVPEEALETQKQVLTTMFGPEMASHAAFFGNDLVTVFGMDSLAGLKQIIDGDFKSAATSEKLAAALQDMPGKRNGMACVSLCDFANWMLGIVAPLMEAAGKPVPPPVSQIEFGTGPGAVYTMNMAADGATFDLKLPAEELRVIVEGVMKAMQGPGPGGPSMSPPPPGVESGGE